MSAVFVAGLSMIMAAGTEPGLANSVEDIRPLPIGVEAPDVTLRDLASAKLRLRDIFAKNRQC